MSNAADQKHLLRVYFNLDHEDWHGRPNEGLWTEPVGAPASVFRLRNSPFFARGVSFLDLVRAVPRPDSGQLEFVEVIGRGGHSTYMLLVPPESRDFGEAWAKLARLGCTYESMSIHLSIGHRTLYAVDVPASSDVHAVHSVLRDGERDGVWLFQEGHFGHTSVPAGRGHG